jgi:tRNA (cytidine/uridine-2'-O-)-methyltransferase
MINLVLIQPDIPQNLGACLRLSACMGCHVHVVEPCGFPLSDAKLKRAGMDYMDHAKLTKHVNWDAFLQHRTHHPGRLLLLETDGVKNYADIHYQPSDYICVGRESAGTPRELYAQMDDTVVIPMREGMRSLNMAMSAGILVSEACRQFQWKFAA